MKGNFGVIDPLNLEMFVAAASVGLGVVARNGFVARRRASLTAIPSTPRSIGQLPHRHRRAARAIAKAARQCIIRHRDGSFEAFTAREAVSRYLPETLDAYLAVPRTLRRVRPVGRPSADDELRRQLGTLLNGLDRIAEADADAGVARMMANGAFLDQRFGPAQPAGAPSQPPSLVRAVANMVSSSLRRT